MIMFASSSPTLFANSFRRVFSPTLSICGISRISSSSCFRKVLNPLSASYSSIQLCCGGGGGVGGDRRVCSHIHLSCTSGGPAKALAAETKDLSRGWVKDLEMAENRRKDNGRVVVVRDQRRTFSAAAAATGDGGGEVMVVMEEQVAELAEKKVKALKDLKMRFGDASIGVCTVNTTVGGLRGLTCMLTETSELDPQRGITFRGHSIEELQKLLPKPTDKSGRVRVGEPLVEGLIWLLLTGRIPTGDEAHSLSRELCRKSTIPDYTWRTIDALPLDTHPMTKLSVGMMTLQNLSSFSYAYSKHMPKSMYWKPMLQDAVSLLAKVPRVAAYIYRRSFKDGEIIQPREGLDWASNFAHMMGYDTDEHCELMRMYLLLHADHEGGNVSAHTSHIVGSALADPYLCYAAGMAGLAGPLHGLANQECLTWLLDLKCKLRGELPNSENVGAVARRSLASGCVIPGYGHAVLRSTDPRYLAQRVFALQNMPDSELFKLLEVCYQTIPAILKETGKVKNPYPNVDCHSGVLLQHYGITEASFYTVLFAVSRAVGIVSQLVWSRVLGLPIERPKSISIDALSKRFP